jgi:hypothetical protein
MKVWRVLTAAGVAGALMGGCSSAQVTLESRPADADSAQDLVELVADTAGCRGLEYYDDTADHWDFTCQDGDDSYLIRAVRDEGAKQAGLQELGTSPEVKAGAYFLVQAATRTDGSAAGDLDRFPGHVPDPAAG